MYLEITNLTHPFECAAGKKIQWERRIRCSPDWKASLGERCLKDFAIRRTSSAKRKRPRWSLHSEPLSSNRSSSMAILAIDALLLLAFGTITHGDSLKLRTSFPRFLLGCGTRW